MGKKESSSQRRQKRESDGLRRRQRKVERRERRHSIFFRGKGDQHILNFMVVTSPVCHFDTSPLNFEAERNTVTSNKREEKKESQKYVVGR